MIRAFVVGHPIRHSRSPLIHGHWLAEHGIDGSYERIDVVPDKFGAFVRGFREAGFVGGNVTIPHKEAAFASVDALTPRAKAIGAVNTLVAQADGSILGDNTDACGFTDNLDEGLGYDWPGRVVSALVLGAGGAARAIVVGLIERGLSQIVVANRSLPRAEALMALAPGKVTAIGWNEMHEALARADLLVNTTSLGMTGHPPLDIDVARLPSRAAVTDIVYSPLETSLLSTARAHGLKTVDGLGMLLHQAVPGFQHWFGARPQVTPALRSLIEADLALR